MTHIRYPSSGNQSFENTHPFKKNLFGRDFMFIHNGTVGIFKHKYGIFTEKLSNFKPEGQTDSEYAFCYILDRIKEKCNENSTVIDLSKVILENAKYIKKYGDFNFLLSDSEHIYGFGDSSLYFIKRIYGNNVITLEDSDYKIKVSDMKMKEEKAIIIATKPLTKEEKWVLFKGLKIFKDGEEIIL